MYVVASAVDAGDAASVSVALYLAETVYALPFSRPVNVVPVCQSVPLIEYSILSPKGPATTMLFVFWSTLTVGAAGATCVP